MQACYVIGTLRRIEAVLAIATATAPTWVGVGEETTAGRGLIVTCTHELSTDLHYGT